MRLYPAGEVLDGDLALEVAHRVAAQALQQPHHPVLRKVLQLMGFRVQLGLVVVVEHRRADRHARIDPAARQNVDGREILGQPQRILQAERNHRRAQVDTAGALTGRRHDRDGGGDARLQVPTPQPDAVEAERLGALDHRQRLLVPRSWVGLIESADGQEPELAQGFSAFRHGSPVYAERACLYGETPSPAYRHARSRRTSLGRDGDRLARRLQRLGDDLCDVGHRLDLQRLEHIGRDIVQIGLVSLRDENR